VPAVQLLVQAARSDDIPTAVPNFPAGQSPMQDKIEDAATMVLKVPAEHTPVHCVELLIPVVLDHLPAGHEFVHEAGVVAPETVMNVPPLHSPGHAHCCEDDAVAMPNRPGSQRWHDDGDDIPVIFPNVPAGQLSVHEPMSEAAVIVIYLPARHTPSQESRDDTEVAVKNFPAKQPMQKPDEDIPVTELNVPIGQLWEHEPMAVAPNTVMNVDVGQTPSQLRGELNPVVDE
jgi:hypothetical protein